MVTTPQPVALTPQTWQWQDHTICYTVAGTGQPLLLIHGFGASIGHWRQNIPVLAAAGYQVYAIDLLGFGGSDKPALDYTVELWVEQIKDFCDAHIQRPVVMVGNSIGGLLSLMVMAQYPELTQGGILLNCAGGLNHRPDELNPPLRLVMGLFTKFVSSPLTGPFLFNQVRQKRRIKNTLYQVYCDRAAVTDDLVELLYQPSCDRGAQQVFASVLTAPPGPSPAELLPQINQPLLVLWGEADPWTPISGSKLYQDQPAIAFHAIPNAGHCPHDEAPDRVNPLILDWLTTQFSPSP
jgi:pimeloyl-ACP methyl ester carboxylesterase